MNRKRYYELSKLWNPEQVLYVTYRTKNSVGKITCSIAFFIESYKKITRLLKRVEIGKIFLKNENVGIVLTYFDSLEDVIKFAEMKCHV